LFGLPAPLRSTVKLGYKVGSQASFGKNVRQTKVPFAIFFSIEKIRYGSSRNALRVASQSVTVLAAHSLAAVRAAFSL
jgi:hypothetical protein